MNQVGFFDLPDHLNRLSDAGDPLEELGRIIDFEAFRLVLDKALDYSDGANGCRWRSRGVDADPLSVCSKTMLSEGSKSDSPYLAINMENDDGLDTLHPGGL